MDPEQRKPGEVAETDTGKHVPAEAASSDEAARAEAKRRAARRRFLVGAAAISAIATIGPRQAHAAGKSVCMSITGSGVDQVKDKKKDPYGTIFCETDGGPYY